MKVVYGYFVMDIVHKGHLLMMKNSKAMAGEGGRLVVGIVSDEAVLREKGAVPSLTFSERLELAQAIRYADIVVAQDAYSPLENITKIKPDILMESEAHSPKVIEEVKEYMDSIGGKVIVMPYFKGQSSGMIKNGILACSKEKQGSSE